MSRIFLTGDTHGDISRLLKWDTGKFLSKTDYLIVLGDFGLIFRVDSDGILEEIEKIKQLEALPFTTLFIDGNHENFDRLLSDFKSVKLLGGNAHKISDSIYHLKRGEIYTINDKTFLTMGGATSIDRSFRIQGFDWWNQENISYKDIKRAISNADKLGKRIDFVLTHAAPESMAESLMFRSKQYFYDNDPNSLLLDELKMDIKWNQWYFGHYHCNYEHPKERWTALYNNIIELEM